MSRYTALGHVQLYEYGDDIGLNAPRRVPDATAVSPWKVWGRRSRSNSVDRVASGIRHLVGVTVGVCIEQRRLGEMGHHQFKLLKPVRQTHLHGEKVAPRYRNLQHEHREEKAGRGQS